MKKMPLVFASLFTALILTSCEQESRYFISISEAESIIPGSWRVDYYNGDQADQFTQYNFQFMNDGSLVVYEGESRFDGNWSVELASDADYYQELMISIAGKPELEALSNTWMVTEMTEVRMNLLDDADSDQVFFLKN